MIWPFLMCTDCQVAPGAPMSTTDKAIETVQKTMTRLNLATRDRKNATATPVTPVMPGTPATSVTPI